MYSIFLAVTTTCSRAPLPAFECTVSGNTLSWTNQGPLTYHVLRTVNGASTYLTGTTALSYTLAANTGTFEVRYRIGNDPAVSTTCPGAPLPARRTCCRDPACAEAESAHPWACSPIVACLDAKWLKDLIKDERPTSGGGSWAL